jgi:sugar phosphate isomerase/epimerase
MMDSVMNRCPMVHAVFIAPKAVSTRRAVELANLYQTGLELEVFIPPQALQQPAKTLATLSSELADLTGQLSLHGPVIDMNPVSLVKQVRQVSQVHYRRSVEMALTLQARYLVFHTQWTPIYTVANCYEPWLDQLAQFFNQLASDMHLDRTGLTLVLENFMEPRPYYHLALLERINHPNIRACLDIGHTNLFSQVSPLVWFDTLKPYLATLHLHNNNGVLDEHAALSQGSVPMDTFLAHVAKATQPLQLMLEVTGEEAVNTSLATIEPYKQTLQQHWLATQFLL